MFNGTDGEFNAMDCSHCFQPISAKEKKKKKKTKCSVAKNRYSSAFSMLLQGCALGSWQCQVPWIHHNELKEAVVEWQDI